MGCKNCKESAVCRDSFRRSCNQCNLYDKEIDPIQFHMERRVNQIVWGYYMQDMGGEYFQNDTFQIMPYNWDDDDSNEWHFWHKPSGVRLEWYKYPLRGVRSNRRLSQEEFADILADCHNSMQEGKSPKVLYDVNKWWGE